MLLAILSVFAAVLAFIEGKIHRTLYACHEILYIIFHLAIHIYNYADIFSQVKKLQ